MWWSMYECIHAYEVWKTVVVLVCVGACLHECVYFVSVHVLTKKGKMITCHDLGLRTSLAK